MSTYEHDALKRLLTKLGYAERNAAWRRPDRTAVFIGDLIDREPQQVEVVNLFARCRTSAPHW